MFSTIRNIVGRWTISENSTTIGVLPVIELSITSNLKKKTVYFLCDSGASLNCLRDSVLNLSSNEIVSSTETPVDAPGNIMPTKGVISVLVNIKLQQKHTVKFS